MSWLFAFSKKHRREPHNVFLADFGLLVRAFRSNRCMVSAKRCMVSGKRFERAKALFRGWQCMRQADGRSESLARAGQGRSITALGPVAFRRMDGIAGATIPGLRSLWHRPKNILITGATKARQRP